MPTTAEWIQILTLISTIVTAIATILTRTAVNRVKDETTRAVEATARNSKEIQHVGIAVDAAAVAIEEVHHATNSMKDALVKATAAKSDAEGYKRRDDEEVATKKAEGEGYQRAQNDYFKPDLPEKPPDPPDP